MLQFVAAGPEHVRHERSHSVQSLGGPISANLLPGHVGIHVLPPSKNLGVLQLVHSIEDGPEQSKHEPSHGSHVLVAIFPKKPVEHVGMHCPPSKKFGA